MKEFAALLIFVVLPIAFFLWIGRIAKSAKVAKQDDSERVELFDALKRLEASGESKWKVLRYVLIALIAFTVLLRLLSLFP